MPVQDFRYDLTVQRMDAEIYWLSALTVSSWLLSGLNIGTHSNKAFRDLLMLPVQPLALTGSWDWQTS
jgi:hypothetical protein